MQLRPSTSQGFIKGSNLNFEKRPQTGKLLSSQHLKNLNQQSQRTLLNTNQEEHTRPQPQTLYLNYMPNARHFGSLCDRGFQEISKQHQLQKFGRTGETQHKKKVKALKVVDQVVQFKQKETIRLIENSIVPQTQGLSHSQSQVVESTAYKTIKLIKQSEELKIDQRTNIKKILKKTNQTYILFFKTLEIQLMQVDPTKRKAIKKINKLFVPFTYLTKLLILPMAILKQYLEQNIQFDKESLTLNYNNINKIDDLIGEFDQYVGEFIIESNSNSFRVIPPCFEVYLPESTESQLVELTQVQLTMLLKQNLDNLNTFDEDIKQTIKRLSKTKVKKQKIYLDVLDSKNILKKYYNQEEKTFDVEKKIAKEAFKLEEKYITANFRPPWIEIIDPETREPITSRYFSFKDFGMLVLYLNHHQIDKFLQHQTIIENLEQLNKKSKKRRMSIDITFDIDGESPRRYSSIPMPQQLSYTSKLNGILDCKQHEREDYIISYKPPQFEIYDPISLDTELRLLNLKELEQLISWHMKFELTLIKPKKEK